MKEVSAVAPIRDGKILTGKRRDNNKFTNPGGHLEKGETPLQGARRELLEETGIDMPEKSFKHTESRIIDIGKGKKLKVHGFICEIPEGVNTSMKDDPDNEVYRWFWTKYPLSKEIMDNHHVPPENNVTLKYLETEKKAFYVGFEKQAKGAYQQILDPRGSYFAILKKDSNFFSNAINKTTPIAEWANKIKNHCSGIRQPVTKFKEVNPEVRRNFVEDMKIVLNHFKNTSNKRDVYSTAMKDVSARYASEMEGEYAAKRAWDALKKIVTEKKINLNEIEFGKMAELIPGGKAHGMPDSKFDAKEVEAGAKVEKEHTSIKPIAKEIAKDHIAETGKLKDDGKIHSPYYKKKFFSAFEKKVEANA